ncbi:MAG: hypothetical protein NWE89_08790 [Candidatus Bathyarchaeota archaeon]|nr:hypothetical protein [Candidatus Bathyarchaeota archaeon]
MSGHTPLDIDGNGSTLETAIKVPYPTKTWTLYHEVHETGEPKFYELHIREGERLVVSLFTSLQEDPKFTPRLVVLGEGVEPRGMAPEFIESPPGYSVHVVDSTRPEAPEYDPFTPSSYFFYAEFRGEVSEGTYYVVVYEPDNVGSYGLALGYREVFTMYEWLIIPVNLFEIHLWEGQSPLIVFGPLLVAVAAGFWYINKRDVIIGVSMWLSLTGGLLFTGTAVNTFVQMVIAMAASGYTSASLLTIIFIALQAGLGYIVIRKALIDRRRTDLKSRAVVVGSGLLGMFVWAGVLIGPILVIASAVIQND